MKRIVYTLPMIFMIAITIACQKVDMPVPQGWRVPLGAEIGDDWRKTDTNNYLSVKGDFNGDGIVDEAKLFVRDDGSGLGLFAFVSQSNGNFKTYLLFEIKDSKAVHAMGIKKVQPGLYKTACGKGYWTCEKEELPEIALRYDALEYFKTESASSYFYWDAQAQTFKRIWISD